MFYGQNNSGPAFEVWRNGDRVRSRDGHIGAVMIPPPIERNAAQQISVYVYWSDNIGCFMHPNDLYLA